MDWLSSREWTTHTGGKAEGNDETVRQENRQGVRIEIQMAASECQVGDRAQAQVAQRNCGVSFLGHTWKGSVHGPGYVALGGPARAGGCTR